MILHRFNILFFCFFTSTLVAQLEYPKDYFRSPIKGPIALAGNFGEARNNHLHSGFDIRTNSRVGMPIYAIADGFVSRINISPRGYGNALYIDHPNGFTSVYAHLLKFNPGIDSIAKNIQYALEEFQIDTLLTDRFFVKKGEIIAYSGNSGSSSGPHLHFEIRDTRSEMPINPYHFGYIVPDRVKPVISLLKVYPLSDNASVNGSARAKMFNLVSAGAGKYGVGVPLKVSGKFGLGISCFDRESSANGRNSVYSIEVKEDDQRLFYATFDRFSFENSRYVNTHIDYPAKKLQNIKLQRCFLSKNNRLGVCKYHLNNGVIEFSDNKIHDLTIEVVDFSGNQSILYLKVKSVLAPSINADYLKKGRLDCLKDNFINNEFFTFDIPACSLYDDIVFQSAVEKSRGDAYSPVIKLQDRLTPLQKYCTLRIKADEVPQSLLAKAFIVFIHKNGRFRYVGGEYEDGWLTTEVKSLGSYSIAVDTIKPRITTKFKSGVNARSWTRMTVRITDNLAGIKSYRGTIDGQWVLFEYDKKVSRLYYRFDKPLKPGKHVCEMVVRDNANNEATKSFTFYR